MNTAAEDLVRALWRAFERFGMTPVDSSRLPLKSWTKTPREKVLEGLSFPDPTKGNPRGGGR